jgi:hypothetical protein
MELDLTSSGFDTYYSTGQRNVTFLFELSALVPGGKPESSRIVDFVMENDLIVGNEGLPANPTPTYYTAAQVDALLAANSVLILTDQVPPGVTRRVVLRNGALELEP